MTDTRSNTPQSVSGMKVSEHKMLPITFDLIERVTPRGFKQAVKASIRMGVRTAANYTHRVLRPERFTQAHARRAGYAKRKHAYQRAKLRLHQHQRPLEYSGRAKAYSRDVRISVRGTRARIRYPSLRVFNLKHRNSHVNMRQEFETVLNEEVTVLGNIIDSTINMELERRKGTFRPTVRRFE